MGHSFTVTTDTDVLIWCNETQLSFGDIHSNTSSENNFKFFLKNLYNVYGNNLYLLLLLYKFHNVF